jgi:predicted MFS family arabinose efflux permease
VSDITVGSTETAGPAPSRIDALRALVTVHPRGVWLMALCNLVLWTGRGMVIPFTVIFFSQIIGISASIVGAGIAASGIGGIIFVMVAAGQIDRRGGRPILLLCLIVIGAAIALHPLATAILPFVAVTILLNFAGQLYWPASDATIASLSDPLRVPEAMAILRVANAVGIGLGGFIGGMIVSGGGLPEYRALFIASAVLIGSAVLLVWRTIPHVVLPSTSESGEHGTWRDVLPDRVFVYALGVLFILIFGFTQMTMSVPAFLRRDAGISEGTIGILFTMNTLIVVLTQIPIAARVNRGNLGKLLAIGSLLWVVAFVCILGTQEYGRIAAFAGFFAFTAGELIFMPATAVIPVRLAPLHLRGRYFAATSIVWGGSWAIASFAAGIALDLPQPAVLWPIMAALMAVAAVGALRMQLFERLRPASSK